MGSLREVQMPQNGINHQGISALSQAFEHNPNLRILNLNDNTFTVKGAKSMAKVCIILLVRLFRRKNRAIVIARSSSLLSFSSCKNFNVAHYSKKY